VTKTKQFLIISKVLLLCWIILNFMPNSFAPNPSSQVTYDVDVYTQNIVSDLIQHDPITIQSNSDFESQGWPGNGTEVNPFIIEGLIITSDENCIHVSGTSVHFVIRNCTLASMTEDGLSGIRFEYLANGRIENCSISQQRRGIYIDDCLNCFVDNCSISSNTIGIILHASNVTITNSNLEWNGLVIDQYGNYTISDVTVNGKPIGYFRDQSDIDIDGYMYGQIILVECTNISVSGGVFQNASIGVQILYSLNCTIQNADIIGNYEGIRIGRSDDCSFIGNTVNECISAGIQLFGYSDNNRIINNTISSTGNPGIGVYDSDFTHIENNSISVTEGNTLVMSYSASLSIKYNTLIGGGVQMSGSIPEFWVYDVASNTIDGKDLAYYSNQHDTLIEVFDESQVILANCTNITIHESHLDSNVPIIAGFCWNCTFTNITYTGTSNTGIELHHSVSCTVNNCTFEQVGAVSINIQYSTNCTLSDNRIVESGGIEITYCHGYTILESNIFLGSNAIINILYSTNCTLRWNTLTNTNGIYARYSDYLTIINNTIQGGRKGALILRSSFCDVFNNTVSGCEQYGFSIEEIDNCTLAYNSINNCTIGIQVKTCSDTLIDHNILEGNKEGIGVSSNYCNVTWNDCIFNQGPGIALGIGTTGNWVYGNLIGWNEWIEHWNARDDGISNHWDNNSLGNYWSDYTSEESYVIPGYGDGVDWYPLPVIATGCPQDIIVEVGTIGNVILWNASARYPVSYEVYQNETLLMTKYWNGSTIIVQIDDLELGVFNYTLIVFERFDHLVEDTVMVRVVDTTSPNISGLVAYEYEAGSQPHLIQFDVFDLYPNLYRILLNNTVIQSGLWNGSDIEIDVGGRAPGTYNFTLVASDTSMNEGSHQILVTVVDTIAPELSDLVEMTFEAGSQTNILTWTATDLYPDHYDLYMNGSLHLSGFWDSGVLQINFNIIDIGLYNLTLNIFDSSGNMAFDYVIVILIDTTSPAIDTPLDVMYENGTTGNSLSWQSIDLFPESYTLLLNGSVIQTGSWNGSSLTFNIDGLNVGVYNLTLIVIDTSGNLSSDSVIVGVIPPTMSQLTILFLGVSIIIIIAIVSIIISKRRA